MPLTMIAIVVLFSSFSANSWARSLGISTTYRQDEWAQPALEEEGKRYGNTSMNLDWKDKISQHLDYQLSLNAEKSNYKTYLITDDQGQEKSLEQSFDRPEYFLSARLGWTKGNTDLFISGNSHLAKSPFFRQGLGFGAGQWIREHRTYFALDWQYFKQENPISYFINEDFVLTKRNQFIYAQKARVSWEELWHERFKTKASIARGERVNDRPEFYAFQLSSALAISESWFLKHHALYSFESRAQRYDNRGYFTLWQNAIELNKELNYEWLVGVSYGLSVERERGQTNGQKLQLGTDTIGVGLEYLGTNFSLPIKVQHASNNIDGQNWAIEGGVVWDM